MPFHRDARSLVVAATAQERKWKGAGPLTYAWWTPEHHNDRKAALHLRARLAHRVRQWFDAEGFIEVEPSCLQFSPGNETHLHAFATEQILPDTDRVPVFLHTSPEFALKKLLAAGEDKIFALGPAFRNREIGPLHLPEFTMLEWYRARSSYDQAMADCATLLQLAAKARGTGAVSFRGRTCDITLEPKRLTVADAFQRFAGIDIFATLADKPQSGDRDALAGLIATEAFTIANTDTWSDLFAKILTALIEPNLGIDRPTLLVDYPLPEAALARPSARDPRVGERFELYCCGIELANGFGELTDANEQRRRFKLAMAEKERIYGERYPIDDEFLAALAIMPEASGVALGFDRLVMLAAGAERLDQVVWTPPKRPVV